MTIQKILFKLIFRLLTIGMLVSGVIYCILGTETGMKIIWSGVNTLLPDKMQVGRVQGTLLSHLKLHDVAYEDDALTVKVTSIAVHWQVMPLLKRKLIIDTIQLAGVDIVIKPAMKSRQKEPAKFNVAKLAKLVGSVSLGKADFGTVNLRSGKARIQLAGTLDEAWHIQWSANIPELSELVPQISGKLVTNGSVQGARMQPVIQTDLMLTKFVSEDLSITSISGSLHSNFQHNMNDSGALQVTGLSIYDFRVPDFNVRTAGRWQNGVYQSQAEAILSPVNRITAKFIVPAYHEDAGLNQVFQAAAKVEVNDFSQFNILFRQVPQVRAFKGRVTGAFTGTGKLLHPVFDGGLEAQNGSVYIPAAQMTIDNIRLSTRYHTGQKVNLSGIFSAGGGQGRLLGTYDIESHALPLVLDVKADHVLVYDTKEYKVIVSPDIQLKYQDDDLQLTGKVLVPFAKITPVDFSSTATLPSDVVIVNQQTAHVDTPTNITLHVQLVLGDDVNIKYRGLKTTLQGKINIIGIPGNPMTATGEFSLAKDGSYRAYGKQLTIQQGRLIYAGNLLSNPGINLRASQTIKIVGFSGGSQFDSTQVKPVYLGAGTATVGIDVNGTVDKPRISLFSDQPGLSQGDILSYMLFGYPQSQATGASSLALLNVASDMVSGGKDNKNIVTNLQQSLGLDELSVGSTEYYDLTNNAAQNTATVNVGRNLGHNLSLHYSVGLFQPVQVFSLRYQINRHLVLQTETSTQENGGDLLYQLESRE